MSRTWNTRIEQNIHLPPKSYSPWSPVPLYHQPLSLTQNFHRTVLLCWEGWNISFLSFFKATISSSLLFKVASSLVKAHWGMTLTAVCCFQFKKRYCFCKLPCIRPQIELSSTFVYDSKMSTGGISARNSHLSQGGEWHWSHLKFTGLILYFLRILGPGDKKNENQPGFNQN